MSEALTESAPPMDQTELNKMLAGEMFVSRDPLLHQMRTKCHRLLEDFNNEADPPKRSAILKQLFGKTGERVYMEPTVRVDYGVNVSVGENFYANYDCTILDTCKVTFGYRCMLGPGVHIYTACHPVDPEERLKLGLGFGKPVVIGNNVWIGGHAIINPGVTLGDNVVVGSGSVVTKSFPGNVVIAGNPAKVVRVIDNN